MLIECEVLVPTGNTIFVGNFGWGEQKKVRKVIDTDLFNWWNEVQMTKSEYGYPYPCQCRVPYKVRGEHPLIIDRSTLYKIREKISGGDIIRI